MTENKKEYILLDEDGDEFKVVFTRRYCDCGYPGCADDKLERYDTLGVFSMEVPRMMLELIESLFDGSYKAKP